MNYSKYKDGSSKRNCSKKWESFKNSDTGNPVTAGSIRYWAKKDNPEFPESKIKGEFEIRELRLKF